MSESFEHKESKENQEYWKILVLYGYIVWEGFIPWEDEPQKYKLKVCPYKVEINSSWLWKIIIRDQKFEPIAMIQYMVVNQRKEKYITFFRMPNLKDKKYNPIELKLKYWEILDLRFENQIKSNTYEKNVWDLYLKIKFIK